jgi:RNA polymerase sigma-54 factor
MAWTQLIGAPRRARPAQNVKQTLQFKLSQQLIMTPQLQQSIRLLQLSTVELSEELENFIADNPLLEHDNSEPVASVPVNGAEHEKSAESNEPAAESQKSSEFDWLETPSGHRRDDEEDSDFGQQAACNPSLREHLMQQLGEMRLAPTDRILVNALIDALDERGYLCESLEQIAALMPPEVDLGLPELEVALKYLQNFEPAGVGARTAAECLELQLKALPRETPGRELALRIVREQLETLAARDFARLKRQLRCNDQSLREAHQLIRSLNPYPGAAYAAAQTCYIVPDVIVKKVKNAWVASLNPDAMPKLRINRIYADILQDKRQAAGPLSARLQEARWLIKNVKQRFDTILRVAQAIVAQQPHFFDHGEVAMRPLVMREIAEALNLHESTVSRVTRQKFMATPRGIFELKYFFGSQVATESGAGCSSTAIRALLKQLVSAEDPTRPLSDGKIAQLLGQQGIQVARRTIAKYRESLHVPPVNLRAAL